MNTLRTHSYISLGVVRFRRWSRNRYAAFRSVGKCVSIGRLSVEIANSSLSKKGLISAFKNSSTEMPLHEKERELSDWESLFSELQLSGFSFGTGSPTVSQPEGVANPICDKYTYISRIELFKSSIYSAFLFLNHNCRFI